jgi:hypothetical protein
MKFTTTVLVAISLVAVTTAQGLTAQQKCLSGCGPDL